MESMCIKCGGLIGVAGKIYGWGGSWCPGHPEDKPIVYGSGFCPPIGQPDCQHCYCKKLNIEYGNTEKPDHKQCCNCGNKQKISDMEKNLNV